MHSKVIATILLVFLCVLPGSKAGFFDGLPLSAFEIILTFSLFWLIVATAWEQQKRTRRLVLTALVFLLVFQALSYKLLPFGWSVCLHSAVAQYPLDSACEPSVETPSGERSFIYTTLDFNQNNFPLYFMNGVRNFNFYGAGQPHRPSLPFTLEAEAYVYPQVGEKLTIKADKNVTVRINDDEFTYTDRNKERSFALIPGKINSLYIKYDTERNKGNTLKVEAPHNTFYSASNASKTSFWISAYKATNIFLLALLVFSCLPGLVAKIKVLGKKDQRILAASGVFLVFFFFLIHNSIIGFEKSFIPFALILIVGSLYALFRKISAQQRLLPFLFIILFFNACILTTAQIAPQKATLFTGGGDELGHESFARSTFSVTNFNQFLRSTEGGGLYYYQPLHRFFLAFLHTTLGEPMWGPYLAQTLIYSVAFVFCIFVLYSLLGTAASVSFGLISFALLSYDETSALTLLQTPFQQAIAFPLLVLAIAHILFLLKKSEMWWVWVSYFLLGLNLGAIVMMRTDWLPILSGILLFLVFQCYQSKFKGTAKIALFLFVVGLSVFPTCIGLRNYAVAGVFAIMPTSGFVNLLPEIKSALSGKISYEEHSTVKFAVAITQAFSGHYSELATILWNNIYKNIIATSLIRQFLWLSTGILSLLNITFIIKKHQWKSSVTLIVFLTSFIALILENSFFGQHNGIAMFAIYDFFIVFLLAINIQMALRQPHISRSLSNVYEKTKTKAGW